jgi:hypothetical protein
VQFWNRCQFNLRSTWHSRVSEMINSSRWRIRRPYFDGIVHDESTAIRINWYPGANEFAGTASSGRLLNASRTRPYCFAGGAGSAGFDSGFGLDGLARSWRNRAMRDHVDISGTASNSVEEIATEAAF